MGEVINKKCPRCGAIMERDDSLVLTSIPPKYHYICPNCGEMEADTYPPTMTRVVENDLAIKGVSIPDEWENFRREAAKDILNSIISAASKIYEFESLDKSIWCKQAIDWADELIKQLKEK